MLGGKLGAERTLTLFRRGELGLELLDLGDALGVPVGTLLGTDGLGQSKETGVLLLELGNTAVGTISMEGDTMKERTYTSMHSNSSRLRCLLRKAAARFLTRRASRLLRPETSGGTKSLLEMRSPTARFFAALGAGLAERLVPQDEARSWSSAGSSSAGRARDGDREGGVRGRAASGKSKSWWVGTQRSSGSGSLRILSMRGGGAGDALGSESGGDGGRW